MATGDEEKSTELQVRWLDPVDLVAELPTEGVREGALCIVTSEQTVYEFRSGVWSLEVVMDGEI